MNKEENIRGLDHDLRMKAAAKYSPEREEEARKWIEEVAGITLEGSFHEALKDGVALCKVINSIKQGGKQVKIATSKLPFRQMENIHQFLMGIEELGVPSFESFQTIDLFEAKNMLQVVDCIFAVSRQAEKKGFQGPRLGPKLAQKVERNFSDEQLLQAKAALPLWTTVSVNGASQKGMGG